MMKKAQSKKRLIIALICGFIANLWILTGGMGYSFLGRLLPYHESFIGLTNQKVQSFNPELNYLHSVLVRLYGSTMLIIGILTLFILFTGFRNRQKWAWFSMIILGALYFGPLVTITRPIIGDLFIYKINMSCLILIIVQIIVSYKEFFNSEHGTGKD